MPILDGIIGHSSVMQGVTNLLLKVAPSDCTVLIHGESGTGKEIIARSIQRNSKRANGPFLTLNCGAIRDTLTEAILFGHEKGSFTGASSDKRGLFEAAHGGTIFLDELGEMPLSTQVKLLRALQEKEIVRVGATRPVKIDVRVIAATNRNLRDLMRVSQFRPDLYYRIATFEVKLPPLRERRVDIPSLVLHFLNKLGRPAGIQRPATVPEDALTLLVNYDWPGNVRELENVINRLIVLTGTSGITLSDVENVLGIDSGPANVNAVSCSSESAEATLMLPARAAEFYGDETFKSYLKRIKRYLLTAALAQYPTRTEAAARLGLTNDALKRQLRYLGRAAARSATTATNNQEEV